VSIGREKKRVKKKRQCPIARKRTRLPERIAGEDEIINRHEEGHIHVEKEK
jgi:hypothetical protein